MKTTIYKPIVIIGQWKSSIKLLNTRDIFCDLYNQRIWFSSN